MIKPDIEKSPDITSPLRCWLLWLLLVVFAGLIVRHAWVSDDAYITFRTVDNFINGYGLRWNVAERVQTYTHPLWMFLLVLVRGISGEVYWSSLVLSLVVSVLTAALLAGRLVRDKSIAVLVALGMCLSRAFIDYATSGLENPLTHLLLVCFFMVYYQEDHKHRFFWLGFTMALAMVNRLDTALLYVPALLYALIRSKRWQAWGQALAGGVPFLLWEMFSLVYYGFLFPNTAYAKLNPGLISSNELWLSGLGYLWNSLLADPLTLTTVLWSFVIALKLRHPGSFPVVLGALAYVLYCVSVGGDFMSGRFMTAAFISALVVIGQMKWRGHATMGYVLLGWILLSGLTTPFSPLWFGGTQTMSEHAARWYHGTGIADERGNYYANTGMLPGLRSEGLWPNHDWALEGIRDAAGSPAVSVKGSVGMYGYQVGPDTYVVDLLGLGDPLMARLPPTDPQWISGHWGRRTPAGYVETLESGVNQIASPALAKYYEVLQSITRDPLFDVQRWQNIWRFNRGDYEGLLESYAYYTGKTFTPTFEVVNSSEHPYVYAYIWNNGSGALVLLDDHSHTGARYMFGWEISANAVTFAGASQAELAQIGPLSDNDLLTIGVIFAPSADLITYEKHECRFWWTLEEDTLRMVLPPLQYINYEGTGGYWQEVESNTSLTLVTW